MPYCEHLTNFFLQVSQSESTNSTDRMLPFRKVEHNLNVILSLYANYRWINLVTKYEDFIHFVASHVSAVTKVIIRITYSW